MHPRFPGPLQPNPDFVTPPGSAVPQCTRCSELVWDPERHNRSRHPREGVWRYRATTSDNTEVLVLVRYHDGRWQEWIPSPVGQWDDDAAIPSWPGTFTPCGGYAVGGPVPATVTGRLGIPSNGCCTIPESVARKYGHVSDFLARINAGEPIPPNGTPRVVDSAEAADRMLAKRLERAFDDVLADPDYGDASGHLGGAGLAALAEVAIDTVYAYLRGTTDAMMARGRFIEISNRDEDH